MKDDDLQGRDDAAVNDAAADAEQTDEQLWDELDKLDPDFAGRDDEDDAPHPETDEDGDPDEDDQGTSDDGERADAPENDDTKDNPEDLREQVERLKHALNSEKGRTAASRREIERLTQQLQQPSVSSADGEGDDPSKRQELEQHLENVREEYGDVVGPLVDKIKELDSREGRWTAFEERQRQDAQSRLDAIVEQEVGKFEEEHPDGWDTLRQHGAAFREWIDDQPKQLRDIWTENREQIVDGIGTAYLVSQFKQALQDAQGDAPEPQPSQENRLQDRRQRQLDGARSSRSNKRMGALRRGPPDTDDPEAIWDYFEKMDAAKS